MKSTSIPTRLTVLSFALALLSLHASAATTSGVLPGNETWSGTVSLTGDVTVPANATLTVLPGTVIQCDARADSGHSGSNSNRIELIVHGALIAEGTAASPIRFTSWPLNASEPPLKSDWHGIHLNHPTQASRLIHCIVEYGLIGLSVSGATPSIRDCRFRHHTEYGLIANSPVLVDASEFTDCGVAGLYGGKASPVRVRNCNFHDNPAAGLATATSEEATVEAEGTRFAANNTGLRIQFAGRASITSCEFTNNSSIGIGFENGYNFYPQSGHTISNSVFSSNGHAISLGWNQGVTVTDCIISKSRGYGIAARGVENDGAYYVQVWARRTVMIQNGSGGVDARNQGSIDLDSCQIHDNGGNGIFVATVAARDTSFLSNGDAGIVVNTVGPSGIVRCVIQNNNTGIQFGGAIPDRLLVTNNISSNATLDAVNRTGGTVYANDNYWGPQTTAQLANADRNLQRIRDNRDDGNLGPVVIASWLNSWPPCHENTSITVQPQDQTAPLGGSATFSVTAAGSNLRYQWRAGTANLPAMTGPQLVLSGIQISQDRADYNVIVTGDCGSITSRLARLTVRQPPVITAHPDDLLLRVPGTTARFHVAAGGSTPLAYRWQRNNVDLVDGGRIAGASTPDLTITAIATSDAAAYTCRVSNDVGSVLSRPGQLTLLTPPRIDQQPTSQVVLAGDQAVFSVTASGPELAFQWFQDAVAIAGATSPTLVVPSVGASGIGKYTVTVSNRALPGGLSSTAASLGLYHLETCAVITLAGPVGERYVVEWSDGLQPGRWQVLTNVALPQSPFVIVDFDSTHARHRFYKAGVKAP